MNQNGQMTIEMVLMTVIVISIISLVRQSSSSWLSNLAEGPQTVMTGMIQDAEWAPSTKSKPMNPNYKAKRHESYKP